MFFTTLDGKYHTFRSIFNTRSLGARGRLPLYQIFAPHGVGHIFQKMYDIPDPEILKNKNFGLGFGYLSGHGTLTETLTEWKFESVTYLQTDLQGRC